MSKQTYTAREVLTYMFSECKTWDVDVDGEYENGRPYTYTRHHIVLSETLLGELLDLAGIHWDEMNESAYQCLKRAAEEDEAKFRAEHERTADARAEAARTSPKTSS